MTKRILTVVLVLGLDAAGLWLASAVDPAPTPAMAAVR